MTEHRPSPSDPVGRPRFNPRMREIALAVLLTVAAVGFIAAALLRGDGGQGPSTAETARKPPGN